MSVEEICPCHKLECPNHGICEKCTSRHLRMGSLNYCGFYTILPTLKEAIAASPESPTAKKLTSLIETREELYDKLLEKHGLTKEGQEALLQKMRDFSDY